MDTAGMFTEHKIYSEYKIGQSVYSQTDRKILLVVGMTIKVNRNETYKVTYELMGNDGTICDGRSEEFLNKI